MPTALAVENLTVRFGNVVALEEINFSVERGEQVAVVGPNGAGKSTLFQAIAGLVAPQNGRILFNGSGRRVEIGYLTQRAGVDWRFPVTVFDVVMMGRIGKIGWLRPYRPIDREVVWSSLERVGLVELAGRQIGELSGGQQQRVLIARALAQEAGLLLMDEPFSGVDLPSQEAILAILEKLRAEQITILLSTHDLTLAMERFDRLALLNRRLISYGPARQAIAPELLIQAYGGKALWRGEGFVMVLGDIHCCGGGPELPHTP